MTIVGVTACAGGNTTETTGGTTGGDTTGGPAGDAASGVPAATASSATASSTVTYTTSPGPSPAPTPSASAEPPEFSATIASVSRDEVPYSWQPNCPVPLSRLRKITMTYWGFDDRAHTGEMVVNRDVADDVVSVFRKLYDQRYPIRRMESVDVYKGSDYDSIEADNTSAFNCRRATGSGSWSEHAYGRAVDLNPRENPFVYGDGSYAHKNARAYVGRPEKPGVIHAGDKVVRAFEKIGWGWGGYWSGYKDYQHFSASGR